jgi:Ca-activated chloride channel family protein
MFNNIEFANPNLFYLLLLLLPIIAWYILKQNKIQSTIKLSSLEGFSKTKTSIKYYLRHVLFILKIFVAVFLIIVLARPQSSDSWKNVTTEGIDIIMALDISTSMLAQDLKPDRIEAAKTVAQEFISKRPNDRIGLVVFAGESFTQCPLTTDHNVLINLFKDIQTGIIEDGTAIGLGLANSVNRLKESTAKSKVVILLTDGVNNAGSVPPITAAEIAKAYNIRVYTIGVGTMGQAPYPVQTPFGIQMQNMDVKIDEQTMNEIADATGGQYFRATDNDDLKNIYKQIDQLEKSKIDVKEFRKKNEEFLIYALIALALFLSEIILRYTILRKNP